MESFLVFLFFYFLFCLTLFALWVCAYRSLYPEEDLTLGEVVETFWYFLVPLMNIIMLALISVEAIRNISVKKGWSEKVVLKGKVSKNDT